MAQQQQQAGAQGVANGNGVSPTQAPTAPALSRTETQKEGPVPVELLQRIIEELGHAEQEVAAGERASCWQSAWRKMRALP